MSVFVTATLEEKRCTVPIEAKELKLRPKPQKVGGHAIHILKDPEISKAYKKEFFENCKLETKMVCQSD